MDQSTIAALFALSQGASSISQFQAGRFNERQGRFNAWAANQQARDAEKRGEEEAMQVRRRASQVKAAQRGAMAAQGVDLGVGSPAELARETDFLARLDEITVRNNAARAALGYRVQGRDAAMRGKLARMEGDAEGFQTLLGAARGYGTFRAQRLSERGEG